MAPHRLSLTRGSTETSEHDLTCEPCGLDTVHGNTTNDANQLVARLHTAVTNARLAEHAPLPLGVESRPVRAVEEYFGYAEWSDLALLARKLSEVEPEQFALFYGPVQARFMIVRELEENETCPSFDALCRALTNALTDTGPWICTVPLSNVALQSGVTWIDIDSRHAIVAASVNKSIDRWMTDDNHQFAMLRKFGDGSGPRPRYLSTPRWEEVVDTRQTAAIVSIQEGHHLMAAHQAESRAKYVAAAWCLLSPPVGRQVAPSVSEWAPAPWLRVEHRMTPAKRMHDAGDRERIGSITEHAAWPLPLSSEHQKLPFRAVELATERHCARALLSSTYAFRAAVNSPSDLQLAERIMYLAVAIESLAEPENHSGAGFPRWEALVETLELSGDAETELKLGKDELTSANKRLYDARNVFVHGSDSVLTNFGYPVDRERPFRSHTAPGHQLSLAALHEGFIPMRWLVRQALLRCWESCDESDFDDATFAKLFGE